MSEEVKSIFLDNITANSKNILDHHLTGSWKTIYGDENPNINNDSLVAYWRLNDAPFTAQTLDESGNSHTITWSDSPDLNRDTPYNTHNTNSTANFNGTSDVGTVADSSDLSFGDTSVDQPFSISFWVKPTLTDPSLQYYNILNKKNVSGVEYAVYLENDPGDSDNFYTVSVYLYDDPTTNKKYKVVIDDNALTENKWYNIVVTYNGDETDSGEGILIYIDGLKKKNSETTTEESGTYVAMEDSAANITIGAQFGLWSPSNYFNGSLSELAIWSRELTAIEAKSLYDIRHGVINISTSATQLSPRVMIRDSDNLRGEYFTTSRMGDKDRTGRFNTSFNDLNVVNFGNEQSVQYPIGLPAGDSKLPDIVTDIVAPGIVQKGHGDRSFNITTTGEDISAFNDERIHTDTSAFYMTGTSLDVYPGFDSPLKSKVAFHFDITADTEQYVFRQSKLVNTTQGAYDVANGVFDFSGQDFTGFCYYSPTKKKWEQIGLINPEDGSVRDYYYGTDATNSVRFTDHVGLNSYPRQFTGANSFSIYGNDTAPLAAIIPPDLELLGYGKIGSPTITSFAPFGNQYHATSSQVFQSSDIIDKPFLLEKITVDLPIYARHLIEDTGDRTRDLSNYVVFLYKQNRSYNNDGTTDASNSDRILIASSSICFYNKKVLTDDGAGVRGEVIDFEPIHTTGFLYGFDVSNEEDPGPADGTPILEVGEFEGTIKLEFEPSVANSVKYIDSTPRILSGEAKGGFSHFTINVYTNPIIVGDKLILISTDGTTVEFIFGPGVGEADVGATDQESVSNLSEIINESSYFISFMTGTTLSIYQIESGLAGNTIVQWHDSLAPSTYTLLTLTGGTDTPTYTTISSPLRVFWPGGSSVESFTVDGSQDESGGKASDNDLTLKFISSGGTFFNEINARTLEKTNESVKVHSPPTRHLGTYGTKVTNEPNDYLDWTKDNFDYNTVESHSQISPFIILPGDELILGIEKTTCGDRMGPGLSTTTLPYTFEYGLTSQQSFSGSFMKIKAEPASMTFFGSQISENKEYINTLNQDLTSLSVHEAIYGDDVIDQFDIEPVTAKSGSYTDVKIEGDITITDPADTDIREIKASAAAFRKLSSNARHSLQRNVMHYSKNERFYDTMLPDHYEYCKQFESYDSLYSVDDIGLYHVASDRTTITGSVPTPIGVYNGAFYVNMMNFPFEQELERNDNNIPVTPNPNFTSKEVLFMEGLTDVTPGQNQDDHYGQIGGCYGFKHGVRNTSQIHTHSTFRHDRYGQFRDMLEQRQFCIFIKTKKNELTSSDDDLYDKKSNFSITKTRAPVTSMFVEKNSENKVKDPSVTSSSNLNMHSTSSLPYFDDFDTYNSGNGRNRVYSANLLQQNETVIASSAVLDFDFDPTKI